MRRSTLLLCALALGACDSDTFTGDGGIDSGNDVPSVGGGDSGKSDGAPDAASPRFCETVDASFCADFDIANDASAPFATSSTLGGWTITFESAQSMSAPTAARFDIPDDAATGTALLEAPLGIGDAGAFTSATLEFDAMFPDIPFSNNPPLYAFVFGCPFGGMQTRFGLAHEGAWRLDNLNVTKTVPVVGTVPTGVWTHVKMIVQLSLTNGSVTLLIGDGDAGAQAVVSSFETVGTGQTGPSSPWPMDLQLGPQAAGGARATTFFYDNVVVRLE